MEHPYVNFLPYVEEKYIRAPNWIMNWTPKERASSSHIITYPATWPSTYHGLQSSVIDRLRDLIHACVPTKENPLSWSPLEHQLYQIFLILDQIAIWIHYDPSEQF
jgi:hypothetical protein